MLPISACTLFADIVVTPCDSSVPLTGVVVNNTSPCPASTLPGLLGAGSAFVKISMDGGIDCILVTMPGSVIGACSDDACAAGLKTNQECLDCNVAGMGFGCPPPTPMPTTPSPTTPLPTPLPTASPTAAPTPAPTTPSPTQGNVNFVIAI